MEASELGDDRVDDEPDEDASEGVHVRPALANDDVCDTTLPRTRRSIGQILGTEYAGSEVLSSTFVALILDALLRDANNGPDPRFTVVRSLRCHLHVARLW